MRSVKEIAEDLVNTGLNDPQKELLDELLAAVTFEQGDLENAVPEGDEAAGTTD
jgi:hypothetical protein